MTNTDLKHRAERRLAALTEIAEQRALIAAYKAEDKAAGFDERALAKVIKEMAAPPEKVRAQLELELVVDTYRETLGVPTTVEAADRVIREAKR